MDWMIFLDIHNIGINFPVKTEASKVNSAKTYHGNKDSANTMSTQDKIVNIHCQEYIFPCP